MAFSLFSQENIYAPNLSEPNPNPFRMRVDDKCLKCEYKNKWLNIYERPRAVVTFPYFPL